MMSFSSSSFNTTDWINAALREREDEGIEAYLAGINLKIHVASQEYAEQLELSMQDIASSSPRMAAEGLNSSPCPSF